MNQATAASSLRYFRNILFLVAIGAFVATSSFGAADGETCATNPESRQLDYWLGNWTVGAPGSGPNAISKVTLSLDQCLVVENWDGGRGHSGQNTFAYSPDDKTWYGMFAHNQGRVHVFTSGKISSSSAEFQGTSHGPKGETVLNRVSIVRRSPNKVEQIWEKSSDNGASWTIVFRGEYSRTGA
jgi:hypothetical protein